jgi:threonyl-tRNA synthetase
MGVIYASDRRRMMVFFMRWQSTTGNFAHVHPSVRFLCATLYRVVTNADYPLLEKIAESAIKDRQKFERLVVSKEKLLEMFYVSRRAPYPDPCVTPDDIRLQYNKYKKYLIETKVPDGTSTTVYRCGPMVDLCVGPHIPHTGKIKAFMITKVSSSEALPFSAEFESLSFQELCIIFPR